MDNIDTSLVVYDDDDKTTLKVETLIGKDGSRKVAFTVVTRPAIEVRDEYGRTMENHSQVTMSCEEAKAIARFVSLGVSL